MKNYRLLLITGPSKEPVSLQEMKNYLKENDLGLCDGSESEQSIEPNCYAPSTITGEAVNVFGFTATVILNVGEVSATGTLDTIIEHSNDGITYETYHTFNQITEANDKQIYEKLYEGGKQYIRVTATVAVDEASFNATVNLLSSDTNEDGYINALIIAAREYCETVQNRALITQVWELSMETFCNIIEVPKGNLQSVDSFIYKDAEGNETTLTIDQDYIISLRGILGRITTPYGASWPYTTLYPLDPIIIRYTCGYGDEPEDVPEKTRQVIKMLVAHWYENRVPIVTGTIVSKQMEFTVSALLAGERIYNL